MIVNFLKTVRRTVTIVVFADLNAHGGLEAQLFSYEVLVIQGSVGLFLYRIE